MYTEALRSLGIRLIVLAPVTGTVSGIVYFFTGRWLRRKLEADYGTGCCSARTSEELREKKEENSQTVHFQA